jgi:hypothetical protein
VTLIGGVLLVSRLGPRRTLLTGAWILLIASVAARWDADLPQNRPHPLGSTGVESAARLGQAMGLAIIAAASGRSAISGVVRLGVRWSLPFSESDGRGAASTIMTERLGWQRLLVFTLPISASLLVVVRRSPSAIFR